MKRLTTNDANHILAPLNLFYAENQEVMVRGGGPEPDYADTTLVELVRRIAKTHDLNIEAEDPESLGDEMYEAMFDGVDTVEGVVALLHAAAVQAAEMRGRLEMIENILGDEYDLNRLRELAQASILKGAIFPGAIVYCLCEDLPCFYPTTGGWYVSEESVGAVGVGCFYVGDPSENTAFDVSDIGKTVFLTREEAEAALKEAGG